MGEYGLHVHWEREAKSGVWAHNSKAGLADIEPIYCGWKEFSETPGWKWVSKYIAWCFIIGLSVFFRKIFILQLVGLVLSYNFTDCDFEKIRKKYQEVIYQALEKYMNGVSEETFF